MYILGISAFYHDSSACLVKDGQILFAIQEERFTRIKHDQSFPMNAIKACLNGANVSIGDIDCITYYEDPKNKFSRLIKTYISEIPKGYKSFLRAMRLWINGKLWIKKIIRKRLGFKGEIIFVNHHKSHAASAFYPSPFKSSAILVMDGVGEYDTTSLWVGKSNKIKKLDSIKFPHSLGLLYSAFTYYTGFKVNSGEYKLMGLAPYGKPIYKELILDNLIDLKEDGSFKLNMKYFNYASGFTMTNKDFSELFGRKPREPESKITKLDMDIAASIQKVTEDIILKLVKHLKKITEEDNLCLAGGVALNCVANGKILKSQIFKKIWIQPASGDAGGSIGSSLYYWYDTLNNDLKYVENSDSQGGSLLGAEYSNHEIKEYIEKNDIKYNFLKPKELTKKVANLLNQGNVIGWFNGRMEFGPRALGSRSILGDPRSKTMQSQMNLKIKYRESFRPFAPIVIKDKLFEWFDFGEYKLDNSFQSPYMLLVGNVTSSKKSNEDNKRYAGLEKLKNIKSDIPAVTHVDGSARIQSVDQSTNRPIYDLLIDFYKLTGCPVLINTSFNVRGEPIVESPADAYRCFMRTEMDYLVLGDFLISKNNQPNYIESKDWMKEFKLD
tara:strand:- start:10482 stop:12314 length:1833 start_codon:yes stop_codon:yes gene_type:complete